MCANEYSFTLLVFVCFYVTLVAEGLPLMRRDRGHQDDIIAGKDFLNVLIESPALHPPKSETTTRPPKNLAITLPTSIDLEHYPSAFTPVLRASRNTRFPHLPKSSYAEDSSVVPTPSIGSKRRRTRTKQSKRPSDSSDNRLIIAVSVSSTVEEAPSNMANERIINRRINIESTTLGPKFEELLSSEDHPNLLAEVNKNEFSVDESEPITSDSSSMRYTENLPANVQALPAIKKLSDFKQNSELLKELSQENLKDKLQPYHHTVIYHDNRKESSRAVSYSTVVQTVPEDDSKDWENENESTAAPDDEDLDEHDPTSSSMAESKDYYVTSKFDGKPDHKWEKLGSSTRRHVEPTERNWGMSEANYDVQQKSYGNKHMGIPVVYGQPEENYEVDEAVSVQTNGRAHGVQPSRSTNEQNSSKASTAQPDSKKTVGYVFEGRKERRYRVEERTSDGFIVGEYGVVNHDDGQLRGVRYTADGTISPQLIYNTLMKFLSL